jgi:hypothetical protein
MPTMGDLHKAEPGLTKDRLMARMAQQQLKLLAEGTMG